MSKISFLEIIMSKCDWKSRCVLLTFWINNLKRNYIPSELIFGLNSWILDFFVSFSNDFFTCQVITIFQMPWSNNVLQILCVLKKSQINSTNWSISISLHFYRINVQTFYRNKNDLQAIVGAWDLEDSDNLVYNVKNIILGDYNT